VDEYFGTVSGEDDWVPRYDITPSQPVVTIRQDAGEPVRKLSIMQRGLVPSWAKEPGIGYKTINARTETVATTPSFREPFQIAALLSSSGWLLRVVATRSCMCDCPASTTRPDLPSHWQYPTRYGDSVTTRLEALGQCIPPSQDGHRNREGTIFLPASRRIGARVSGRVSRCEPL
jgi:hypothetical protein